jgi:hypothetical protein
MPLAFAGDFDETFLSVGRTGDRLTVGKTRPFILLSSLVHDVAPKNGISKAFNQPKAGLTCESRTHCPDSGKTRPLRQVVHHHRLALHQPDISPTSG